MSRLIISRGNNGQPYFSCIMPTYNRVRADSFGNLHAHDLERSVECFVRQSFRGAELIIVNDTPGQTLHIDSDKYPNVRICNLPTRFDSLGEKCNWAIEHLARGLFVTRWDDDDINFPFRLAKTYEYLANGDQLMLGVCFEGCYYWSIKNEIFFVPGTGMQCDCYGRRLFNFNGDFCYPHRSTGEDRHLREIAISRGYAVKSVVCTPATALYLYNRSPSPYMHVSIYGDSERAYEEIGRQDIISCSYKINPHWDRDWTKYIYNTEIPRPDAPDKS